MLAVDSRIHSNPDFMSNSVTQSPACKRTLPHLVPDPRLEECRERNRLAQKAFCIQEKEKENAPPSTTISGRKRKLEDRDGSGRALQRLKMRQEAEVDIEIEDEDEFDEVTNDFVEKITAKEMPGPKCLHCYHSSP